MKRVNVSFTFSHFPIYIFLFKTFTVFYFCLQNLLQVSFKADPKHVVLKPFDLRDIEI